jgi:PEGA domain
MLIECQCGNKLKINDNLIGKKVRCPRCQSVFVVQEQEKGAEPEERVASGKTLTERTMDEDNPLHFDQTKPSEKNDADELEPSRGKSNKNAAAKLPIPAWRKWGGVGLLSILAVALGVVVWAYWYRGKVELAISGDATGAEVFVDGAKHSVVNEDTAILYLMPGEHEIKVTKADHKDITKQVSVAAFKEQRALVVLEPAKSGGRPSNPGPSRVVLPGGALKAK